MGNEVSAVAKENGISLQDAETLRDKFELLSQLSTTNLQSGDLNRSLFVSKFPESQRELAEHIFDALDTDSSGTISFRAYALSVCILADGSVEDKAYFAFRLYDHEKKGYLELKDITTMLKVLNKSSRKLLSALDVDKERRTEIAFEAVFERMNPNSQGQVDEVSFVKFCVDHPVIFEQLETVFIALKRASGWDWERVRNKNNSCLLM